MNGQPISEDEWKAESDARTLQEAEAIKADEKRMGKAQEAAKRILEAEKAKAEALERIANSKMTYDKSPKPPGEIK